MPLLFGPKSADDFGGSGGLISSHRPLLPHRNAHDVNAELAQHSGVVPNNERGEQKRRARNAQR
jgi:hypothetical protein